jgi:hypothetical protein
MKRRYIGIVGLLAVSACGGAAYCTLIGCDSQLTVALASAPTGPWRIDVVGKFGESVAFDCPDSSRCGTSASFRNFIPARATVTVTYGGRTGSSEVTPSYAQVQPNGKDCGPICTQATVTVPLP